MMVVCSVCDAHFSCVAQLKYHHNLSHFDSALLKLTCGENGCNCSFDSLRAYRLHLLKTHGCPDNDFKNQRNETSCTSASSDLDADNVNEQNVPEVENVPAFPDAEAFLQTFDESVQT